MTDSATTPASPPASLLPPEDRGWRQHWLLSTVWLVFLVFPILSLWFGDHGTLANKIVASILVAFFAVAYASGFATLIRMAMVERPTAELERKAVAYLTTMIGLVAAAALIGGWALLGLVPFVISFSVFNLRWWAGFAMIVAGLAAVVVPPLIGGVYDDLWVLTPVAVSLALASVLIRMLDEREQERQVYETVLAISDERNRVARDVHDVLGHSLTAVVIKAELTERLLAQLDPADAGDRAVLQRCGDELVELQAISRRALAEIRSTVGGLRTPTLEDEVAVARTVLTDAGVALTVTGSQGSVPANYRPTMGWVVREAVINVVRHAKADNCQIEFGPFDEPVGDRDLLLRIVDDGIGLGSSAEGNGLRGLRERVEGAGATLRVTSTPGTKLEVLA